MGSGTVMHTNKTRPVRSLELKEVQGPVFVQRGGDMTNVFGHEGKVGEVIV